MLARKIVPNKMHRDLSRPNACTTILIVVFFVFLSLFASWEMGAESWGYWYFARVFAETGQFVVTDRSPLYTLYLYLFTLLPYPASVTLEYLTSTSAAVLVLVYFIRPIVGPWASIFSACIWIPYLQSAEPAVQKLALITSLLAMLLRAKQTRHSGIINFYALLSVATLFRQTYLLLLLIFLFLDLLSRLKRPMYEGLGLWRFKIREYWTIGLLVILFGWFKVCQSDSLWNNVWFTDASWFPISGKTMTGGVIQAFNMAYILKNYGTYVGHDFYFTNQEAFGGATDAWSAIMVNPKLVVDILWTNVKALIPTLTIGNWVPHVSLKIVDYAVMFSFVLAVLIGAIKSVHSSLSRSFILGSFALASASVVAHPSNRYMMPLIPLYILAAYWYGVKCTNSLRRAYIYDTRLAMPVVQVALIVMCSSGQITAWLDIGRNIYEGIPTGRPISILESKTLSVKRAHTELISLLKDCKGVMAYEALFLGAFSDLALDRLYTPWEIPPFGRLGESGYQGLTPSRVDCLLISEALATAIGGGTNIQLRYKSFVAPYADQLRQLGAITYDIPKYGRLLRLPATYDGNTVSN